jgi:transposase
MHLESLVRKTLGLKGHRVEKVSEQGGEIVVILRASRRSRPVCSHCSRKMPGYDTRAERHWRHVPIWGIPVVLVYRPRRGKCPHCGITIEKMTWNQGKCRTSLPLIVVIAAFARILAFEEVSRLLGVHWNTVRSAVKAAVEYGLENRDTTGVIAIGTDEISRRKGHTYVTMVYDLTRKRLLWCGEGREKKTLRAFFEYWGERCGAIRAVCLDMLPGFDRVVEECVPDALIVFDKFHIAQQLMAAVDTVRKEEARSLREEGIDVLKKTRYIWVKNPENLTDKQKLRLSEISKLNLKVNRAYLLKEGFRHFWDYAYRRNAEKYLDDWLWMATHSRLEPLRDFAWMIRKRKENILNYFKVPLTNGSVEGMNRKAKVVSNRAYGYRTFDTFQLALYHVMGDLPMPETTHRFV